MIYTPLEYVDLRLFYILVATGFSLIFLGIMISVLINKKLAEIAGLVVFGIGFVLAVTGVVVSVTAVNEFQDRYEKWRENATKGLSSHYGIVITEDDLKKLEYPENFDKEFEYRGTASIKIGPDLSDFSNLTLAIEDNKVYLFTQVGAEYVELEPVSK